jgi:hypothetical protein
MLRERLLGKLKLSQIGKDPEKSVKHKMSSSEEFQKGYDAIWKAGPQVNFQNPNDWRRNGDTV